MKATQGIPPASYYDSTIYEIEQKKVFHSSWIFVGFTDQVTNHNDFITKKIGGIPVVIQNFSGELYALLNICSHRKATLQIAECGNRQLICPYHSWSYKDRGKLSAIPQNSESFSLAEADMQKLSLQRFDLEVCGTFIFVRISTTGPTLKNFLGSYYTIIEQLSEHFTDPIHSGKYPWKTNWKLGVESILESYHVHSVHPQTFATFVQNEYEVLSNPPHNIGNYPIQDSSRTWWKGVRRILKLNCLEQFTEYNHFFIYPNIAIGITNGSLISVQTYEPLDPTHCELHFRLRLARSNRAKLSSQIKNELLQGVIDFNHATLEEDRLIVETCQKNMPLSVKPAILGVTEERIIIFHAGWSQQMEEND